MATSTLDLPSLTELLTKRDLPAETLLSILSEQEPTACLLFNRESIDPDNIPLLQLYYSAHLFTLLLVDDLYVYLLFHFGCLI